MSDFCWQRGLVTLADHCLYRGPTSRDLQKEKNEQFIENVSDKLSPKKLILVTNSRSFSFYVQSNHTSKLHFKFNIDNKVTND